jgi:hypothetical protein
MNDEECEYCKTPERYGVLPAEEGIVPKWNNPNGASGGGTYKIHPPQVPVTGFVGVRCKQE